MNPRQTRRPRRAATPPARRGARRCSRPGGARRSLLRLGGSGSGGTPAAGATPTAIQVMATASGAISPSRSWAMQGSRRRGARGRGRDNIAAQSAPSVAAGQSASVFFFRAGQGGPAGRRALPAGRRRAERHARPAGWRSGPFLQGGRGFPAGWRRPRRCRRNGHRREDERRRDRRGDHLGRQAPSGATTRSRRALPGSRSRCSRAT